MAIAARPTTYNGIAMRSRLEAAFAAFLDRHGFAWQYEPRAFASAAGQYLPDFQISDVLPGMAVAYVDVKGTLGGSQAEVGVATRALLDRMNTIRASEPTALLGIACDSTEPFTLLLEFPDRHIRRAFFGMCACCHGVSVGVIVRGEPGLVCRHCGATGTAVARLDPFFRPGVS